MIIAIYKDDGLTNGCGQDVILTAPREEAHTFPTYEDFRHADCVLLKSSERKEARYIKWYEASDIVPRATVADALRELRYDLNTEGNPEFSDYREGINYAIERLDATITALGLADETQEEKR